MDLCWWGFGCCVVIWWVWCLVGCCVVKCWVCVYLCMCRRFVCVGVDVVLYWWCYCDVFRFMICMVIIVFDNVIWIVCLLVFEILLCCRIVVVCCDCWVVLCVFWCWVLVWVYWVDRCWLVIEMWMVVVWVVVWVMLVCVVYDSCILVYRFLDCLFWVG